MKRYPKTIMATACLPWNESFEFMEEMFRQQVTDLQQMGLRHIYLFGTAGEGYAVSDEQFEHIVRVFASSSQGTDMQPIVGLISLSFQTMLQRAKKAYALGIRDFQISFPSWGALTESEMLRFFHEICGAFPDCRFIHYNNGRSKKVVSVKEYATLAAEIPNLAAVKYTALDMPTAYQIAMNDSPLQFFCGELGFGYAHLLGGECSMVVSLGLGHMERTWRLFEAAAANDLERLAMYQQELSGIREGILTIVGAASMDGAYDKLLYKLTNPAFPLRMLAPYDSSTDEQYRQYRDFLRERFPAWLAPNSG